MPHYMVHFSYNAYVATSRSIFRERFCPISFDQNVIAQFWKFWNRFLPSFILGSSQQGLAAPANISTAWVKVQQLWTLRTLWIRLHFGSNIIAVSLHYMSTRSSQTMNFSDAILFNVLILNSRLLSWTPAELKTWGSFGNEAKPQPEHRDFVSVLPLIFPPRRQAHPQSTHPLAALNQQTWEASPPGLEDRMNTMTNMFSRPLVFLTLTFNNLLMTSG